MKILKITLLTVLAMSLVQCNNAYNDRTDDVDDTQIELQENDARVMNDNNEATAMYRQLNMSPAQIQRFENEHPNFHDSLANPRWQINQTIDSNMLIILDGDQYRQYERWKNNRQHTPDNTTHNSSHDN